MKRPENRFECWLKSSTIALSAIALAISQLGCGDGPPPPPKTESTPVVAPTASAKPGRKMTPKEEDAVLSGKEKKALREAEKAKAQ